MGLDITVYAITQVPNDYGFVINDTERFKKYFGEDFIKTKVNQYYNFDAIGISEDRYDWCSTSYGVEDDEDTVWEFQDKESPFYKILKELGDPIDPCKITDDIREKLISSGIEDHIKDEYGQVHPDDNLAAIDGNGQPDYNAIHWFLYNKSKITIKESDIPLRDQEDKVVYGVEIGYQRKGLNDLFYDEYTGDDYFVFTKERLEYIYNHYVKEDYKEYFKENILDKHEDGKTFVTFDW